MGPCCLQIRLPRNISLQEEQANSHHLRKRVNMLLSKSIESYYNRITRPSPAFNEILPKSIFWLKVANILFVAASTNPRP